MSERIGTGEPYTQSQPRIADRCPCCGGQTLFIGAGGWLTCSVIGCKAPGAASDLLAQAPALAASQAECARLREALERADAARCTCPCHEDGGYCEECLCGVESADICRDALALPADTSALDAERAKEGERLLPWARFGAWAFEAFWSDGEPGDIEGGDAQEHAVECGLLRRWQPEDGPGPHCDACEDTEGEPGSCSCLFPTLKPFGPAPAAGGRETT